MKTNILITCYFLALFFAFFISDLFSSTLTKSVEKQDENTRGCLFKQFEFNIGGNCVAITSDGEYFYVLKNTGRNHLKYDLNGNLLNEFSITGVNTGLTTLTYDGRYFWGSKNLKTIYKIDMQANPPAVAGTISSPVSVLNCAYDPNADNSNGGLWVGGFFSDIVLLDLNGNELTRIPAATHGVGYLYGTAFDNFSEGGPYLWTVNSFTEEPWIRRHHLPSGEPTGVEYSLWKEGIIGDWSSMGGMLIMQDIIPGTTSLVLTVQERRVIVFDLKGMEPTSHDIGVFSIEMLPTYPNISNYFITGRIKNFGTETITSCEISYQIDNEEIKTSHFSDISLLPREVLEFKHPISVEPVTGNHIVKVWTSLPNGVEDKYPLNDSLSFSYIVFDPIGNKPRTLLLEAFSSSTCGPCVDGNNNLMQVLDEFEGSYALIKYQMNWPGLGDAYYTAEGGVRRYFYNVYGVPHLNVDGPAFVINPSLLTKVHLTNLQEIPSVMELNVDYFVEGQTVYATAEINSTINFTDEEIRLFMAVVETVTYNNSGQNGETEFHQVMKKFLPDANGIEIEFLEIDVPFITSQSWEFKGNYRLPINATKPINHEIEHSVEDFNNLTIVAWVQNMQSKVVYQSCNGQKVVKINQPETSEIKIYPNPFINIIIIDNAENVEKITVTNLFGQIIKEVTNKYSSTIYVNTNELKAGVYFITLYDKNFEKRVHKIIKQ